MPRSQPILILLSLVLASATLGAAESKVVDLGPAFVGQYDVTFRPFAEAKRLERQVQTEVARFTRDDKKWTLIFDRAQLPRDIPIQDTKDSRGNETPGYLTAAVNAMRSGDAKAEVYRSEVIEAGNMRIGLITAHSKEKGQPVLLQQALCEINPRLYYSLVMTSPAPAGPIDKDPAVMEAAEVFKAIVDTIDRVDLSRIREDQDDRLVRTRGLFVNWTPKFMLAALVPEQMLRFRQDGKDIGYAYVVEQPAESLPKTGAAEKDIADPSTATGLRVGMRMRTIPEAGKSVDVESWMFVTVDRRHEVWKTITVVRQPEAAAQKDKELWFAEVGASDMQTERVFDKDVNAEDLKDMDKKEAEAAKRGKREEERNIDRPYRLIDTYNLTVRTESRTAVASPLQQRLPPFYLPQALTTLLPRLVPLNIPNGYAFASYNSDTRQVMYRYVDVRMEEDVVLDGTRHRAIPVIDRLGYDGPPTTHYMTLKGKYLGSINPSAKIEIIPTDRETLSKLFKDVNLTQPDAPKDPR